jgi:hypothetical protein
MQFLPDTVVRLVMVILPLRAGLIAFLLSGFSRPRTQGIFLHAPLMWIQ